jgi:F-type H+-transporting ATPase subunit gamma
VTETLQILERRIESAEELHSVTRTMRGLAAVNLRHYEIAAAALDEYEAIIEDGLHIALRNGAIDRVPLDRTPPDAPTAIIAIGSNQGLCGSVNRHVTARVRQEIDERSPPTLVVAIGARMALELALEGVAVRERWDLPATVEAITPRAEQILVRSDDWRTTDGIARVLLVFPQFLGRTGGYEPVALQLAPTDRDLLESLAVRRWPSRVLPTFTLPWEQLVSDLIRQALLLRLHRGLAQTMASVSFSRLIAMDAAQHNIDERVIELRERRSHLRQTEITEELLDVVSGFEVLRSAPPR